MKTFLITRQHWCNQMERSCLDKDSEGKDTWRGPSDHGTINSPYVVKCELYVSVKLQALLTLVPLTSFTLKWL